jgi:tripartite motif-containing protein 71
VKFDNSGKPVARIGSPGNGDGHPSFDIYADVAVDSQGNIYVTDNGDTRTGGGGYNGGEHVRIQKFDSSGRFVTKWGTYGRENGMFVHHISVAASAQGSVYVIDDHLNDVQKFDSSGRYLTRWFGLNSTGYLAVDAQENVYVADFGSRQVKKFDSNGQFLTQWGADQLNRPNGIALDGQGNVFIADSDNHAVYEYNSAGQLLVKWGSAGSGDGQFVIPIDVAVDGQGNVYVADGYNDTIQKFHLK